MLDGQRIRRYDARTTNRGLELTVAIHGHTGAMHTLVVTAT
jgi:hypothetical protein